MLPKGKQSDRTMNYLLVFIMGTLGIALTLPFVLPSADASDIMITPVEGSKLPGCEETEKGCYTPNFVKIKAGKMVVFKNTDTAAHSFTSDKFDSQIMINDGTEFNWTVEEGVTTYSCLLHPWATGTIVGVTAPTIDTITDYPNWVVNLFDWYDQDLIDYDTFMNALIWLMSYDIVKEVPEPEPVVEETTQTTNDGLGGGDSGNQPVKKICERVLCD